MNKVEKMIKYKHKGHFFPFAFFVSVLFFRWLWVYISDGSIASIDLNNEGKKGQ